MSCYEGLPIYRAAVNVALLLEKEAWGFSRLHKYQLGTRLRDGALDYVRLVAMAQRRSLASFLEPLPVDTASLLSPEVQRSAPAPGDDPFVSGLRGQFVLPILTSADSPDCSAWRTK